MIHDSVPYPVSRLTPSPQGRQTLQASVVHRSSIDNGQPDNARPAVNNNLPNNISNTSVPRNVTQSPRSPSSADILEVMPLYPRSQSSTNQVTNVYQLREFKREPNNNQGETAPDNRATEIRHVYSNDINRDLAFLRSTLRQESAMNTMKEIEDENIFLESLNSKNTGKKKINSPISPTLSNTSEHYAQLSLEQQQQQQQQEAARMYMNLPTIPNDDDTGPTTPLTPKQVEYCNLTLGMKPEINTYANLSLGDMGDSIKNAKQILSFSAPSEHNQKFSESDTFTSMSPVEELEVNYAILDIDSNKEIIKMTRDLTSPESQSFSSSNKESVASYSSQPRGRLVSQCSVEKVSLVNPATAPSAAIGYTTIDFDKTVALTSVASGADCDADGNRKTRHNSCNIICGSPASNDKTK